jgi:hypothetical protein
VNSLFRLSFFVTGEEDLGEGGIVDWAPEVKTGRPDIMAEVAPLAAVGSGVLLYCSGPAGMGRRCADVAAELGMQFREQSFLV